MQIVITADEQSGQITVEANGREPYRCESAEECLDYLEGLLTGGEPAEEAGEGEQPAQAMWAEEAAKRPPQPGIMS